ncbi:tRNA (adenosine(37)-N6)-threonylcarbamoyltransferase complex ATPase subunit type 1 TsaE [Candidatus Pelagibacter sp.]|nr:tRNA (adenosine(37)-N6)-threonylcarbamoyltransferase complex ATPase subunit type 1 TsaE [Candidatus Pelagibacter sp.]
MEQKVLSNQMPIAIKDSKIDITSEKLTKELAKQFTKYLKGGEFVFLYGEMGVGKTTFVKYFINEYQKINNLTLTEITSPTFSLLNEYQVKDIRIKHYDLFRINRKEDINNLDIFEKDKKLITLIEWPQLLTDTQNIKSIDLTFNYLNDLNDRSVDIKV